MKSCVAKTILHSIFSIAAMLLVAGVSFAGGPGTTSANFLKFGVGARPLGMGGAFGAVCDDVNALYWNPAGLANIQKYNELSFTHHELGEDMKYEFLAYAKPFRKMRGTLAFSYSKLDISGIQGYDTSGYKTSVLNANDTALQAGYGYRMMPYLMFGVSLRSITETLDTYSASAYSADLGFLSQISVGKNNSCGLAFVVQNIGTPMKFINEGSPLPLNMKIGASWKTDLLGSAFILASEFNMPSDNSSFYNLGGEFRVYDFIALRAGYQSKDDVSDSLRTGLGLRVKSVDIDYAFVSRGDFDVSQRISFTFRFGMKYDDNLIVKKIDKEFEEGEKCFKQGDMVGAYHRFKNILLVAPGHKRAQEYLAKTELKIEEVQISRNIEEHFVSGEKYFMEDNLSDAQAEFESILAVDRSHQGSKEYIVKIKAKLKAISDSLFRRGVAFYETGDYENTIREMNKVLTFDTEHEKAKEYIRLANEKIKRLEVLKKQQADEEEQRKAEKKVQAVLSQAIELYNQKKMNEALSMFKGVIEIDSKNKQAQQYITNIKKSIAADLYQRAQEFYNAKDLEKAAKYCNDALDVYPNDKESQQLLDKINPVLNKEKLAKAEEYNKKGLVAYSEGKIEAAINYWSMALNFSPNYEEAKANIKRAQKELEKKQPPKK
ncbi:MAG: PorV/PorQ family protein [Elusimicrobia bacterium]|nr:PorV/PorQ family protein [Candidatus Liberimonas magnetica]